MLILSRKPNESVVIDGRILVTIVRVEGEVVKVGIEAPKHVPVHRREVYEEIQKNNQEALAWMRQQAVVPRLPAGALPPQEPPPRSSVATVASAGTRRAL